jgi:error-prone DNA polymerase
MSHVFRYAELHCLSNFSFLRGASHPHELVSRAAELGYSALALTDECSVAGVVRAYSAIKAQQLELKLIIGAEFAIQEHTLVLLAPDRLAYAQLCRLITLTRGRADKGEYRLLEQDLGSEIDRCICLWRPGQEPTQAQPLINKLISTFHHREHHQLYLLNENLLDPPSNQRARVIQALAKQQQIPIVCANDVHMHTPQRQALQDALTALRHKKTIHSAQQYIFSNGERHLRSENKLRKLYPPLQWQHLEAIVQRCHFDLASLSYEYPKDSVPKTLSASAYLRQEVSKGEQRRFPNGTPEKIRQTIDKELKIIKEMRFEHFFLTIYDIVTFARARDILCQGRGSAANSVVCYCLGITEANPLEVSLLFERFINASRNEPPDIDVDFESQRREEVIQYIYQRYGRERAALTATVISYRAKSALRDMSQVMGLDLQQLEASLANTSKAHVDSKPGRASAYTGNNWLDEAIPPAWQAQHANGQISQLKQLVRELVGFPRHLSQHVGGFVISAGALTELVPIENAAMAERTVIQWNKDDLHTLKLIKVDILSLGMLTAIRKALAYINQSRDYQHQLTDTGTHTDEPQPEPLTLQDINRQDQATFNMICRADTVGVFQIESRAQMSMLPRLKPRCYYDLVVQVAIVRPGPIHGDMVHPYLKRRQGQEAIVYPMPELIPVLERTYGVPIFQEQVIHFAMVAADFSADEADQLRRSMASWQQQGHMHHLRERLCQGMRNKGFDEHYIAKINRQIEGFGEYGFPESHAASFALLAYFSSWMKCHYPAEFCCALLNSQPMGFYTPGQLVQDLQRHQVSVQPININHSHWDNSLEYHLIENHHSNSPEQRATTQSTQSTQTTQTAQTAQSTQTAIRTEVRLGLRLIKGLDQGLIQQLLAKRPKNGFNNIEALSSLPHQQREILARAGALSDLSTHRYQAQWQAAGAIKHEDLLNNAMTMSIANQSELRAPDEFDELIEDYRSSGISLHHHPLELLRRHRLIPPATLASQLPELRNGLIITAIGLVNSRQKPHSASNVTFLTLEDDSGCINAIVWQQVAVKYLKPLLQARLLLVIGRLDIDPQSGVTHLIVRHMKDLSDSLNELTTHSRHFH